LSATLLNVAARPYRSHVGRAAVRRHRRLRYASPSVRTPPRWLRHCSPRPRRLAGATSTTSLRLAARRAAATPAPPHRRRDNYIIVRHHTRRPARAAQTTLLHVVASPRRHVGATTSTATTHCSSLHVNRQKSSTALPTFF